MISFNRVRSRYFATLDYSLFLEFSDLLKLSNW